MSWPSERHELVKLWPRLSFFYGFSFFDLARMPRWAVKMYYETLPELLAESRLHALEAAAYPHMRDGPRRAVVRGLERSLPRLEPAKLSVEAWEHAVGSIGISVEKR